MVEIIKISHKFENGPSLIILFSILVVALICIILGIIGQLDTMDDFKLIIGHCDLYFMVQ